VSQPFHSSRDDAWRSHAQRLATFGGSENRKEAVEKKQIVEAHEPHWPSIWIYLGFVLVLAAAELVLGWSLFQGYLLLACALILLIAHLMHAHILAFHEAAHGTLCPSRRWNEAIGMAIGSLSFQGLTIFRIVHQTHHAYLGTERDEELWPFVVPGTPRWMRRLISFYELTFGITYTPFLCFRTLLRAGSPVKYRAHGTHGFNGSEFDT
jgi:fatty acid desaturase